MQQTTQTLERPFQPRTVRSPRGRQIEPQQTHATPAVAVSGVSPLTDVRVAAAAAGDRKEIAHVIEALAPQIRMMVSARLSRTPAQFHALEEIVQESSMALTAAIERLQTRTVAGLKAFVSGIVANKVADYLRTPARHGGPPGSIASLDASVSGATQTGPLWQALSQSGVRSPLSAADLRHQFSDVMIALGQLKPEHREVITLAFFDQLATRDIGERLGISPAAASMLLIRAVKTLRRNLTGTSAIMEHADAQPH